MIETTGDIELECGRVVVTQGVNDETVFVQMFDVEFQNILDEIPFRVLALYVENYYPKPEKPMNDNKG